MLASSFNALALGSIDEDSVVTPITPVETYGLSPEVVEFLNEHNVELTLFSDDPANMPLSNDEIYVGIPYNEKLQFLMKQTEAYGFTNEQIHSYIQGFLNATPTIVKKNQISTLTVEDDDISVNRPNLSIDDGIGWEVSSDDFGYCHVSTYAKLPTVTNLPQDDIGAYMFYSIEYGGFTMDFGLVYCYGTTEGKYGWRGVSNGDIPLNHIEHNETTSDTWWTETYSYGLSAGDEVYIVAEIGTNGILEVNIYRASDFALKETMLFNVGQRGITRTNAKFIRQITLCDENKQYNSGTTMSNAQFYDAYLYSTTSWSLTNEYNVDETRCETFAPPGASIEQITVHSREKWCEENISLHF